MGVQLDDQRPLLTPPGEGETVTDRPERTLRILGELDELIVTWFRYEPGEQGPDAHIHQHHTDAFYVLEGELELSLGPELTTFQAEPGDFAGAPPGVVHTFRNASDSTVVFLNLHVPSSGFGDHIRGKSDDFDQLDPPADGGRPLADAVFTRRSEAEIIRHETSLHRVLCDLPQLTAIDMTFQPKFEGVDPHTHADHADTFYVLEGEIEFRIGDEPRLAGPGTFVVAPPGAVHGFSVGGPEPIRFFNLHAPPGGFLDRLRS
jgi:quercetin dioxygenase-like cupin family protein